MTKHWNQSRGTFRMGEPEDHFRAKHFIADLIGNVSGYDVHTEYPLVDPFYKKINYKHNYDIVAFGKLIVVEIDDPDLHSKPRKRRNDAVALDKIRTKFPNSAQFIRLDKDEITYAMKEGCSSYIEDNLWGKVTL